MDIPLIGCGGIETWRDASEYFAVGASLVQLCSVVMWRGYGIIDKLTKGLAEYLDGHGYASVGEIKGKALPNIVTFDQLNVRQRLLATVDGEKCTGCKLCVPACDAGAFKAIEMDGDLARVIAGKCDGCGLCVGVCPVDAIAMASR
jgi:dihydropyrimidine dehydrogenase (NAD+) subunit PreA